MCRSRRGFEVPREATLLLTGFRSCAPGVRIAPRMKHRENNQLTAAHAIVNAEWKAMHAYPANIRNDFSKSARRRACTKQRALDLRLKLSAETCALLLEPAFRRGILQESLAPKRGSQIHFPPDGGARRLMLSQDTRSSGSASSSSKRARSSARCASESCIAADSSASMLFQISSMSARRCSTSSLSSPNFFSDSDTARTLHLLSMHAKPEVARRSSVRLPQAVARLRGRNWAGSTRFATGHKF